MLLGIPDGLMVRPASFVIQDRYLGMYFHDDFQLSSRLTLNLGLRYEYQGGLWDPEYRLPQRLDLTEPIPGMAEANSQRGVSSGSPSSPTLPLGTASGSSGHSHTLVQTAASAMSAAATTPVHGTGTPRRPATSPVEVPAILLPPSENRLRSFGKNARENPSEPASSA